MKILFVTHFFYPNIGGIEIHSELLALAYHRAGIDVHMITWTADTGEREFPFSIIRKPSVSELIKQYQWADIVHENNPSLRLAWPLAFFKRRHLVALHTWINRRNGSLSWQDRLKFAWLKRADVVVAVSESVKEMWPAATVIGNPYNNNLFKILPGVSKDKDFVCLGRLVSDKGIDIAIGAFGQIVKLNADQKFRLTIIGDGPERAALERLAQDLKIEKQVTFVGALRGQQLVQRLNEHRFIVIPSRWKEPFGNVALEGMACGCIPIVADGGGLPDAVGKAGLIFERGSESSLVSSMQEVLQNAELNNNLRLEAGKHLAAHYPEVIAKHYLDLLSSKTRSN